MGDSSPSVRALVSSTMSAARIHGQEQVLEQCRQHLAESPRQALGAVREGHDRRDPGMERNASSNAGSGGAFGSCTARPGGAGSSGSGCKGCEATRPEAGSAGRRGPTPHPLLRDGLVEQQPAWPFGTSGIALPCMPCISTPCCCAFGAPRSPHRPHPRSLPRRSAPRRRRRRTAAEAHGRRAFPAGHWLSWQVPPGPVAAQRPRARQLLGFG